MKQKNVFDTQIYTPYSLSASVCEIYITWLVETFIFL